MNFKSFLNNDKQMTLTECPFKCIVLNWSNMNPEKIHFKCVWLLVSCLLPEVFRKVISAYPKYVKKSDRIFLLYFCFHITVKSSIFWLPPSPLQIVDYILSVNSTENKYRTKGVLFFWSFSCCSQQVVGLYFTSCSFTLAFNAGSKHSFPPTAS